MQPSMQSIAENLLMTIVGQKAVGCLAVDFIRKIKLVFKSCGMDYKLHV